MAQILINHVQKVFKTPGKDVIALKDINLEIKAGEFVCLLGASGSAAAAATFTIADHTANDLYLTESMTMAGTTDTPQLATLELILEP